MHSEPPKTTQPLTYARLQRRRKTTLEIVLLSLIGAILFALVAPILAAMLYFSIHGFDMPHPN